MTKTKVNTSAKANTGALTPGVRCGELVTGGLDRRVVTTGNAWQAIRKQEESDRPLNPSHYLGR